MCLTLYLIIIRQQFRLHNSDEMHTRPMQKIMTYDNKISLIISVNDDLLGKSKDFLNKKSNEVEKL